MTIKDTATRTYFEYTVDTGASKIIELPTVQLATVAVHPGEGGSVSVEFTISTRDRVRDGTARWIEWGKKTVSTPQADVFDGPVTAVRITAIGAPAIVEVQQ